MSLASDSARPTLAFLNYLFLLAVMVVVAGILSAAMTIQYTARELPCPLCLLERLALFGVCFGIILNFRSGFSYRHTGVSLLFAVLLLVIASRQTLLDIYPRPGHAYIGSAVFGLHMPVWSIIIALCLITAYALKLAVIGSDRHLEETPADRFPALKRAADVVAVVVVALCAINLISVVLQCGLGQCHTFGYRLLQ